MDERSMIVIADDITGAAEIAGIAFSCGLPVHMACGSSSTTGGVTVIATDSRSMTEAEAVAETRRAASLLPPLPPLLFKKTDSALRGHVVAELCALMEAAGKRRAVYLPANPSKGRIIRNGTYYINNVPIGDTAFSFDPEFPAFTSSLRERFPEAEASGIIMPDAESLEDIGRVIARYDAADTLFAGAADLFTALLGHSGISAGSAVHGCGSTDGASGMPPGSSVLILCGSTQSKPLDCGIASAAMPENVYNGSHDLSCWDVSAYERTHSLILTIPFSHRTGHAAACHLRTAMAAMAKRLAARHCPDHLVIEGGATAWATLQALGWTEFDIVAQHAPGVVTMRTPAGVCVTLKPGSYPWGALARAANEKKQLSTI